MDVVAVKIFYSEKQNFGWTLFSIVAFKSLEDA